MANFYSKDELTRQIDNELEAMLRLYVAYYAESNLAQSRSDLLKLFIRRAVRKSKRGASQEPQNLRARIGEAGFGQAWN